MNNFSKKLHTASEGLRLSHDERASMRASLARHMDAAPAVSPMRPARSPYLFMSHKWMTAFASLLVVVFAGGSTAYASQSALPGSPLYPIKVNVVEPLQVALAPSPAAKAAVHVALAQKRVEEAEMLVQQGALTASTSAELAANFEGHAQSADTLANEVEADDPAASVQIRAQLQASSDVGGAVLAALGNESKNADTKEHSDDLAVRVLALGRGSDSRSGDSARGNEGGGASAMPGIAAAPAPKSAGLRTMAVTTSTASSSDAANTENESAANSDAKPEAQTAGPGVAKESTAAQLQLRAQGALDAARAQLVAASSTLSATTTASVQASLAGIEALIADGSKALSGSLFGAAVQDFTDAYSRALRLQGLLKAERSIDGGTIAPLLQMENFGDDHGKDRGDGGDR